MFTTKPETFKKLSIEERTAYSYYFEEKLSELKSTYSELTENNEINLDCENEIDKLEETLWCLEYGFSSLYDYYGLNDITDIEPSVIQKDGLFNYVDDKLQNKIISYLSFIEYVYTTIGNDILKVRGFNCLRPYFYPYLCSTNVKYTKYQSDQLNIFIYLLLKNKFKKINRFIHLDLRYLNGYIDLNIKTIKSKKEIDKREKTQNEYLKEFFLNTEHSTDNFSDNFHPNVIYSSNFEETLDEFMNDIFNKNRYDIHLTQDDFGYIVDDFSVTRQILKKYFGISYKHAATLNL